MLNASGFVNRRSGVQLPEAAPRKNRGLVRLSLRPSWPSMAFAAGHAQVRETSSGRSVASELLAGVPS